MHKEHGHTLGAILLIAGTAMGGGMLAMPLISGLSGFYPSLLMSFLVWACMLSTGFLFLEATLSMPDGVNVISIAKKYLGVYGKIIGASSFIFIYYCLLVAYFAGSVPLLINAFHDFLNIDLPRGIAFVSFGLLFGAIIYLGTRVTDRMNFLFMAGFLITFFSLIILGFPQIKEDYLQRTNWSFFSLAGPIFFTAYGYHNIIPSMSTYLKRNVKRLKIALILGTFIPFVFYGIWQLIAIGSLSEETLYAGYIRGEAVTPCLQQICTTPLFRQLSYSFSFFAIVTSLLGVALSMVDFLGDGLKIQKDERIGLKRLFLTLLVFIPPFLIALIYPGLFLKALAYAGGFGETILNALLPVAMVWSARYHFKLETPHLLPGGKGVLILLFLFASYITVLQIIEIFL